MANFNDFMSDMRGGQPSGLSALGGRQPSDRMQQLKQKMQQMQQARPGQPFGGMPGQRPGGAVSPQPMPGQRPGGPISALPMPYPDMGGGLRPGQGLPFMNDPMRGGPQPQVMPGGGRLPQQLDMTGVDTGMPPAMGGGMPPPGMNPQFMQQGQALDAARQAALQGIPAFQQLQQLSGQFKMGGQPTPEQAQQMEQLSQQLNTNPTLQGFNDKMQALSTQYGMNGMGAQTPPTGMPPGMAGLSGINPQVLAQQGNFKSQADMNAAMMGQGPAGGTPPPGMGGIGGIGDYMSQLQGKLGGLPQGMNGGVPQPQQLGAGLPQQGALNALQQAQPPVGGAPQSAMAGQAAAPAQGGLGQIAAMSSPTAPVKGAALPAQ